MRRKATMTRESDVRGELYAPYRGCGSPNRRLRRSRHRAVARSGCARSAGCHVGPNVVGGANPEQTSPQRTDDGKREGLCSDGRKEFAALRRGEAVPIPKVDNWGLARCSGPPAARR